MPGQAIQAAQTVHAALPVIQAAATAASSAASAAIDAATSAAQAASAAMTSAATVKAIAASAAASSASTASASSSTSYDFFFKVVGPSAAVLAVIVTPVWTYFWNKKIQKQLADERQAFEKTQAELRTRFDSDQAENQRSFTKELADASSALQSRIADNQVETQKLIAESQQGTAKAIAMRQIADSVSNKRQAWIDALRSEMTDYIEFTDKLSRMKQDSGMVIGDFDFRVRLNQIQQQARALSVKITFRLNPTERPHIRLIELIDELRVKEHDKFFKDHNWSDGENGFRPYVEVRNDTIVLTRKILKDEWERVKRGD